MAKQIINVGTAKNDGTGDSLRDGAQKINDNFSELYTALGATTGNLSIVSKLTAGDGVTVSSTTGDIVIRGNIATNNVLGGIKVGENLSIDNEGVLSANPGSYTLPIAEAGTLGGIKIGNTLTISETGVVNISGGLYELPTATSTVLGGVKVGARLSITAGVLSADVQTVPVATDSISGTVKIDNSSITINGSGVISATVTTGDWAFSGNAAYNGTNYDQGLYFAPGGESTSYVFVPGNSESSSTALQLTNGSLTGKVAITTYNKQWQFDANGSLVYPNYALQTDTSTVNCPGNAGTVVYTVSGPYQHTIKLLIQVEGFEGANDIFDTQACEMILAKSFRANTIAASVYGVVHTSVAPLATFTANWNALAGRVEVICTAPSSNSVNVRIFATEISTSD